MYDLTALDTVLAGTIFAGKLNYLSTTASTNSDAVAAARDGAPHGTVFFADEQTAGRGRGDHGWHSAAGQGLYVSVILRLQFDAVRLPLLPLAVGLAAAEAVREVSSLTVDLRWPNDLLVGARKAGGILVEAQAESKGLPHAVAVVAGIGINVHQREFPPALATPATSLDLMSDRRISRSALLVALLKSLERETSGLIDPAATRTVLARLENSSTWIRGRAVEVHGPQACTGVTAGLDEHGFLRVETASGIITVQTGGLRALESG